MCAAVAAALLSMGYMCTSLLVATYPQAAVARMEALTILLHSPADLRGMRAMRGQGPAPPPGSRV